MNLKLQYILLVCVISAAIAGAGLCWYITLQIHLHRVIAFVEPAEPVLYFEWALISFVLLGSIVFGILMMVKKPKRRLWK